MLSYRRVRKVIFLGLAFVLAFTAVPPRTLFGPVIASAAPLEPSHHLTNNSREAMSAIAEALRDAPLPPELQGLTQLGEGMLAPGFPLVPGRPRSASEAQTTTQVPLSVSRVQAAYRAADLRDSTLVVTFTVTNHQPPALSPDIPENATFTDTVALLEAIDPLDDPNTVRNVLLADVLTSHATFADATPHPDRKLRQLAWNLGDIPPLGTVTATLTIQVPSSVATRIELDEGAAAWGTWQGQAVMASAAPIVLWPDTLEEAPTSQWLTGTVDANPLDEYVLEQAGELGQDADQIFEYVRTLGYEAYRGSLRGARGTQWSQAGNSLDQANLLVAMLRGSGVPARYRHGTLSRERAQELILSMFPTSGPVVGYVPAEAEVSDPANDSKLLAEAEDHWWVEAYLDGAWVAMDPSFRYATRGQTFTSPVGEPLSEVPDALRHKVTVTVETEHYHQLAYLHVGLEYQTPMEWTFYTAELVGEPLALHHFVVRAHPPLGCLIYCWSRYTYTPYLRLGDREEIIKGHDVWELLSNYPLGQYAVTAAWLHFDVQDAEGHTTRYTRGLADRIKAGPRTGFLRGPKMVPGLLTADVLQSLGPQTPSLVDELDSHTIYFNPSWMAEAYAAEQADVLLTNAQDVVDLPPMEQLESSDMATREGAKRQVVQTLLASSRAFNRSLGASYTTFADSTARDLAAAGLVRAYPDTPRITIASTVISGTTNMDAISEIQILDLLQDNVRVIAYPAQAQSAELVYRTTRGIHNTFLESHVGESLGKPGRGAAATLQAAQAQGIPLVYVDAHNLDRLPWENLSVSAKAHIIDAAQRGYGLFVPERMVSVGGEQTVAWWQLDLRTGEMIGVGEDGTHQFLVIFTAEVQLLEHIVRILKIIVFLLRYLTWRLSSTWTWWYFWKRAVPQAAGSMAEREVIYAEALKSTKEYMHHAAWPLFNTGCIIVTGFTCEWLK